MKNLVVRILFAPKVNMYDNFKTYSPTKASSWGYVYTYFPFLYPSQEGQHTENRLYLTCHVKQLELPRILFEYRSFQYVFIGYKKQLFLGIYPITWF